MAPGPEQLLVRGPQRRARKKRRLCRPVV